MKEQNVEREKSTQAEYDPMDLFEEISFREMIRKVIHGLRQPGNSGEYKYARLQLLRLMAPVSAILVPCLVVILLMFLAGRKPTVDRIIGAVMWSEDKEEMEVVKPEKIPDEIIPSTPLPEMKMPRLPSPHVPDVTPESAASDSRFNLTREDAVALTESVKIMPEMQSTRDAAGREQALGKYKAPPFTEVAVMRALRWLKKEQNHDGSWEGPGAAMTSLALLAYLAHNETPESEEFGVTVEKALRYLIGDQKENGRFKSSDNEEYTLPIAAYALCEAYNLTRNPVLKFAAERAVQPILDGQNPGGGWTYKCQPSSSRTDTSYSGWCAQAVTAATVAGLNVRCLDQAVDRAIIGIKKNSSPDGAFGYTRPGENSAPGDIPGALTGVGTLALQLLGAGHDKETQAGQLFLDKVVFNWNEPGFRRPIYNWYYITQAKFHAGGPGWDQWNKAFAGALLKNQVVLRGAGLDGKDIGYWDDVGRLKECNLVYNTTLCTLMLEVYYRYLPSYKAPNIRERGEELSSGNTEGMEGDVQIEVFPG